MMRTLLKKFTSAMLIAVINGIAAAAAANAQTSRANRNTAVAPASRYVMAGRLRTHYLEWNRKKTETIVLLHGLYDTSDVWKQLAQFLSKDYRVIAVDRRGAGKTSSPPDGYDAASLADDVAAFLEALRLDRPHVIGHSAGANVSLTLGSRAPGKVRSIVLVDGGFWPRRPETDRSPGTPCDAATDECRRKLAIERGSMEFDPEPLFSKVTAPALLIAAIPSQDRSDVPADLVTEIRSLVEMTATRRLSNGRFAFIESSGHWIQTDQPERLADSISTFLRSPKEPLK